MDRLPPLNSLKAFVVSGRTSSFALAARELGVSAAAVSLQVRNLERWFGKQLFRRTGNRIALTDAGHLVFAQAAHAFGELADMARRITEGESRPRLVVSVPFSLAETWLAPRLVRLIELYPQMTFDLRVEDDPIDLQRHNIDIRISYGEFPYSGLVAVPLLHDDVLPVCSPSFWRRHDLASTGLAQVTDNLFIHTKWGEAYASHPSWADWFARANIERRPDPAKGRRVGLSSLAISAARLGLGIALGQRSMALNDLEAGQLVALSSISLRLGHPYRALVLQTRQDRPDIRHFLSLMGKLSPLDAALPTDHKDGGLTASGA
ncbi:LysR substrate-binding domain-containing protein [Radicibacter daui]|uniref:LysR substrate-binding domain-containing protein n=1 Tax=Radicibacter daui TaxID=3064829 RepID=UPI004046EF54